MKDYYPKFAHKKQLVSEENNETHVMQKKNNSNKNINFAQIINRIIY